MRWICAQCGAHAPTPGTCPMCGRAELAPFDAEPMDPEAARDRARRTGTFDASRGHDDTTDDAVQ